MDRFTRTLHGYNPEEVNKFLDDVIVQVERIVDSNKEKTEEINSLRKQIEELSKQRPDESTIAKAKKFDELEGALTEAVNMAKNTGKHMMLAAKQERNLIIEEAKNNANMIIKNALDKSSRIELQAEILRRNIIRFKRKLRTNLEEQLRLVDDIEVIDTIK